MAKNSITDYDNIANNNTDIQSVDIAENCAPSGINNAIREVMADLADVNDGTVTLTSPKAATLDVTGNLTVDTNTLYVDSVNNSVGIGTSSPAYPLHVNGRISYSGAIGEGADATLSSVSTTVVHAESATWQNQAFYTGGSERMRVDSSGNVGIGTSSPSGYSTIYKQVVINGGANPSMLQLNNTTTGEGTNTGGLALIQNGVDAYLINPQATGTTRFFTNNTERMRIDASGNVGIGTSSPATLGGGAKLTVNQAADGNIVFARGGSTRQVQIGTTSTTGYINADNTSGGFAVHTNGTERMRIDASGNVLANTTFANIYDNSGSGGGFVSTSGWNAMNGVNDAALYLNRVASDGVIQYFFQDGSIEGNISVSGTTVSYNGGHLARWSQLTDGTKDETIVKGTVMTNLDQMAVWSHDAVEAQDTVYDEDGNIVTEAVEAKDAYTEDNEQLNCMAVSSVEGDPNVAGVFVNWDNDDDESNDMNVAMTGDMVIRIAQGTTVARGDLLMSAGDGTAKPQGDDIVRSKTIAKVTSTNVSHTYDDGSYLVPCVLMAC